MIKQPSEILILFTRFPKAGETKTRLAPILGEQGAADFQRKLTEYVITRLKPFFASGSAKLEIHYEGCDQSAMKQWLGNALCYRPQAGGDMGCRMRRAFEGAFFSGASRVVLIGSDIPGIDSVLIRNAFAELRRNPMVLGPARDGGYYLIGLKKDSVPRAIPDLFEGICWGSETVIAQTMKTARRKRLRFALLKPLQDMDRPEDLAQWERRTGNASPKCPAPSISIIIPTLNEAGNILETLENIRPTTDVEILVVDGGSTDNTLSLAASRRAKVLTAFPPRSAQMNAGAFQAAGEVLLFLHADTRPPPGFDRLILESLDSPDVAAGAFELGIDSCRRVLRVVERCANWRSRRMGMPYGDQGIFLSAAAFRSVGGFPVIPIMEDFEMMQKLKKQGDIVILPAKVMTSPRRWENLGVVSTTIINQLIVAGYFAGVSPGVLAGWYRRLRGVGAGN